MPNDGTTSSSQNHILHSPCPCPVSDHWKQVQADWNCLSVLERKSSAGQVEVDSWMLSLLRTLASFVFSQNLQKHHHHCYAYSWSLSSLASFVLVLLSFSARALQHFEHVLPCGRQKLSTSWLPTGPTHCKTTHFIDYDLICCSSTL